MNRKTTLRVTLPIFIILFLSFVSFGQFRDVKWEPWQAMPCYNGISVSVLNMGYGKEAGGYLWGIRIRNDYNTPVTVSYKLTIGEENKVPNGFQPTRLLKKGDIWTDGGDVFTAKLFKSPSKEYFIVLDKVCFDGMKCGGKDECYAECDAVPGKPNQPCGLNDNAAYKNKKSQPTEIEEWQEVLKGQQKAKIIKLEDGLKWNANGQEFLFNKISRNIYKYSASTIETEIVFMNESQLMYYFRNLTDSSYNTDLFYKRISSSPVNKKVFSGKTAAHTHTDSCLWIEKGRISTKYHLVKTDAGYLLMDKYNSEYSKRTFLKTGENQYQYVQKSYGTAADMLLSLFLVNDYRFEITYTGGEHPGAPRNPGYTIPYYCLTAFDNADEWVSVKDNSIAKLVMYEGGVFFYGNGDLIFCPSIAKDTYQTSDQPCNPYCYKTIIRITGQNSFSVDYTNLQGQINRTDDFVRRSK